MKLLKLYMHISHSQYVVESLDKKGEHNYYRENFFKHLKTDFWLFQYMYYLSKASIHKLYLCGVIILGANISYTLFI